MGLFKSKLQREYEEWVKFSRGQIPLPDNEYERFQLFMAQREAYNKSNSNYDHGDTKKSTRDHSSNSDDSNSSGSSTSADEYYTVREYWQENELDSDLIDKIECVVRNNFLDSYHLGQFYSLETDVNANEQDPLFGSSAFLINVKISWEYSLIYSILLGSYNVNIADALSALEQVTDEVRSIERQREKLLREASRAVNDFVKKELTGIHFADSRLIKINVDIDLDLKVLDEVARDCKFTIDQY